MTDKVITFKSLKTTKNKTATKFFLKYADKWHSFAKDYETVNIICCLVNLQILNLNEHEQVKVNVSNAKLYINN
jgi:hypothetical protein